MRTICVSSLYHCVSCIMICAIIILCVNPPPLVWKKVRKVKSLSRVQLFVTSWTIAFQAPLSMWFCMQEYWAATPSSKGSSQPRDRTQVSFDSCIAGGFFTSEPVGKPKYHLRILLLGNFILVTLLLLWSKNMITKSKFKNAFLSFLQWNCH